jgi:hypothetical protein
MMTSRSLICLLENQNGGKLQKRSLKHARFFGHDDAAGVFEIVQVQLSTNTLCYFFYWYTLKS